MKYHAIKLIIILSFLVFNTIMFPTYASSAKFYLDFEKNYHHNSEILNSTTSLFKEDGRPKASIGTVLYTYAPNGEHIY